MIKRVYCANCGSEQIIIAPQNYHIANVIWDQLNASDEKELNGKTGKAKVRSTVIESVSYAYGDWEDHNRKVIDLSSKYRVVPGQGKDDYLDTPIRIRFDGEKIEGDNYVINVVASVSSEVALGAYNRDFAECFIKEGEEAICGVCRTKFTVIDKTFEEYDREIARAYITELRKVTPVRQLAANNAPVKEQELLKHLVELSGNAFSLEKRLEEILVSSFENERILRRVVGHARNIYLKMNRDRIIHIEQLIEEEKRINSRDIEIMEKELGIVKPEVGVERPTVPEKPEVSREDLVKPEKPILREAGLFNKSRIEKINKNAEMLYEQALIEYRENIDRLEKYEKDIKEYEDKMLSFNEFYDAYKEKEKEYEEKVNDYICSKVLELEKQCQELKNESEKVLREESDEYLVAISEDNLQQINGRKNVLKFYKEEASEIEKMLEEQYRLIDALESTGIIFPKYNDVVAWNTMYEYFLTGRVDSLAGTNGAYNLYESELRSNAVISKLDVIISQLDAIKDNQYMLYQLVDETKKLVEQLVDYSAAMVNEMINLGTELEKIRESTEGIAYNTVKIARNSDIIAKTNTAIAFMKAIWG